jgi:hypothetical protein
MCFQHRTNASKEPGWEYFDSFIRANSGARDCELRRDGVRKASVVILLLRRTPSVDMGSHLVAS